MGASKFDETNQDSENIEEFVAGLRFEQRGKLDMVSIKKSSRKISTERQFLTCILVLPLNQRVSQHLTLVTLAKRIIYVIIRRSHVRGYNDSHRYSYFSFSDPKSVCLKQIRYCILPTLFHITLFNSSIDLLTPRMVDTL
jgi:hypothetical protein